MTDFPALAPEFLDPPTLEKLAPIRPATHPPRFLLLYGSLRERSFSRFMVEEADRLLRRMGAETYIYDPRGLPQPDDASPDHPKVKELRDASLWSEGHVWCSPERHGDHHRHFQIADRLVAAGERRGAADAGTHACGYAGERRVAVVQRCQRASHPWPLDADDHHPEPVFGRQGL